MRQALILLSALLPGRRNPRKVKPAREAHQQMVASIRAVGILHALIVRPDPGDPKRFQVIAGHRRLAALREIHRGNGHGVKVPCQIREVDEPTADALSLSENFTRAPMHPLDEAEAFAKLAAEDGKGIAAVVAEFGVPERYVRQRMKLASLASVVKAAYREGQIDTATAEAFAGVPEDRQAQVWQETGGHPRHADHVRNIIASAWIDAGHALFDLGTLPAPAVSRDLFSEKVLIERTAFMEAQGQALQQQRQALLEAGWSAAVVGTREEVYPQVYALDTPESEFDARTTRTLARLEKRRTQAEKELAKLDEGEEGRIARVQNRIRTLEAAAEKVKQKGTRIFSEATKGIGTAFLILNADGEVRREYRVPHRKPSHATRNGNGHADGTGEGERPTPPSSETLNDRQLATTFTHQTLAVREALLAAPKALKRLLVMLLHDKVRSEALAMRHDANGVTLHATQTEGFTSPAREAIAAKLAKLDPFADQPIVDDVEAYQALAKLSPAKLDALIEVLIAELVTAHSLRPTPLVQHLATELKVDVRKEWRPDAAWLANYQKCQLAHLMAELRGPAYNPDTENHKKSELVEMLAALFTDAAEGRLEDKALAERVNTWLPANLRATPEGEAE
jgi:ParB family transcriptional regulator, chromosome partitioning protein